jgi:hypothetical protein
MKIYNPDGTMETINLKGTGTKIKDIWEDIEILDNIYIPAINKTYPVFEIEKDKILLRDKNNSLTGYFILTKNFSYDVELIKAD